ncbi:TIR domain-containing protein [Amycolatopsis sp. NBC_01307]|uniref:SEFIR domain-containing protein n=1 Tax=Amycolatopsis sp. NBC_01307 TaxID=2903561 RepID=UPI002E14CAFC|nr:TIR domain-containing protein [Amycolatopsis sp. NBC_01307]
MTLEQQESADPDAAASPRVFITYSHDDEAHKNLVREFATFLRDEAGVDVHLDQWADDGRRDWSLWAIEQLTEADFVLVIASPDYKRRAEGAEVPEQGRGAQFEAAMIRDNITKDLPSATRRFLPVVLPGRSVDEIPVFLNAHSTTRYEIPEFTVAGVADLLIAFTGVPRFELPRLGTFIGAQRGGMLLTSALNPVRRGLDVRVGDVEIDGMRHTGSIAYRPSVFALQLEGVVEYNLGKRFTRFEAVAGVLDDADDADQTGCFQVILDGVPQDQVSVRMGHPVWLRNDLTGVLRLKLVAYRPKTTVGPLITAALVVTGRRTKLPALAWGSPTLFA